MRNYMCYIQKLWILPLTIALLSSCLKQGGSNNPLPSEIGTFDFATTKDVNLDVNYNINYPILFEVYAKDPLETGVKDEAIEPFFRAITDENGRFTGSINTPTAYKKGYLYTEYMGVPSVVELPIAGQQMSLDLSNPGLSARTAIAKGGIVGNLLALGNWNSMGTPDYMLPRIKLDGELINNIMYNLPESKNGIGHKGDPNGLIKENQAIGDIKILQETEVNLVFMHEGASMSNTIAYYCYPTANPPASKDDLTRIIAIPNFSFALSGGELSSGDRVALKYWDGQVFHNKFPAGISIGWCLIASGYNREKDIVNGNSQFIYYSDPRFNPEQQTIKQQHCVALYDKSDKIVALGFEDQNRERVSADGQFLSDSDFNDAVYYVETSVKEAIDTDGIPEITPNPTPNPNPEDNYIKYSGSLAFEDLWPSKGDYDMNDVVIDFESTHYRNSKNLVVRIVDKFTPKWSGAGQCNGFGYQLGIPVGSVSKVEVKSDYNDYLSFIKTDAKGMEIGQKKATIVLFENIKTILEQNTEKPNVSKSFTVTISLSGPTSINNLTPPPYNPFIICGTDKGRRDKEVHLPNKQPTDLANMALLGTLNDKSSVSKGIFYISDENYMFALHLPVTFDYPEEKQRLENAYPRYSTWAASKGAVDTDWYLDPKKPF